MVEGNTPKKTMRIAVDALNLSHGGGTIVMSRIVKALMQQSAEVVLFTARNSVLNELEVMPSQVSFHPEMGDAKRTSIFRIVKMPKLLRSLDIDGLISFNFRTPVSVPQITYHINVIPHLSFAERVDKVGLLRAIFQAHGAQNALQKSTANAFESEHLLNLARQHGDIHEQDFVAYTGIDVPRQSGARAKPPKRKTVCLVTSGANHKNNDIALRAFRAFAEKTNDAHLEIFGRPDAIRASLSHEMAEFCDSSGKVEFRGYVGRKELYCALSTAYALLTASELESFYMVALEAMIVGCPVVAADISSVRESTQKAGQLFPVGDWEAAANVLISLLDVELWSKVSQSGYKWALQFDADTLAQEFAVKLTSIFHKERA